MLPEDIISEFWWTTTNKKKLVIGLFFVVLLLQPITTTTTSRHAWEKPGCTKVGHTRRISIPGCVEFYIQTNACRGFCVSYSLPSLEAILKINSKHVISSFGHCCNIIEAEDVKVNVMCVDGPRDLLFKSATKCACYHCKKD